MFTAAVLWAFLTFCLFLIYDYIRDWHKPIRGASSLPWFGDMFNVLWNWSNLPEWVLSSFAGRPNDTTVFTKRPGKRSWLTLDPVNVEHILKTRFDNYVITPLRGEPFHDFLGHGIFNADGNLWKLQRKTASYEFSNARFREWFLCRFVDHSQHLLDDLQHAAETGKTVDMQIKFSEVTLGAICHVAFGLDLQKDLTPEQRKEFGDAFNLTTKLVPMRFIFSPWVWKTFKFLNLWPESALRKALKTTHKLVDTVIQQRKNLTEAQMETQQDLLSRFLIVSQHSEDPYLGSDKFVQDMVMSMLLAGRDTTSNCLSWLFYELTRNPDVQQKVVEEIHAVVGVDSAPTFEQLKHMPYLQAVMTETLRMWPSVPIDPKVAAADDVLPSGHQIRAGETVELMIMVSGRSVKYWDEPNKFMPERFLNEAGDFVKPSPFKAMMFQAGPRLCLGMEMAYLEVKTVVTMLLQKYRLHLAPNANIKPAMDITLPMVHGLPMTVVPVVEGA